MQPRALLRLLVSAVILFLLAAPLPARAQSDPEQDANCRARAFLRGAAMTGYTRPDTTITLVSEFSGKVLAVTADVGEPLPTDRVFARLDPTFPRLDLEANRVEQQRLASRRDYFAKEVERYRELVGRDTAAQATLDELEQQHDQARHELDGLAVSERRLLEQIDRLTVKAPPMGGGARWRVMERMVEQGEWVAAGQPLATLGDFSTLIVPVALTPREYDWLRSNAGELQVTLPDNQGMRLGARIDSVAPGFDAETRKIGVDLAIEPRGFEARGGVRVVFEAPVADQSDAVLVAERCVAERYEEYWLTKPDGQQIRAVVLDRAAAGPDGEPDYRLSAPGVRPGDVFVPAGITRDDDARP